MDRKLATIQRILTIEPVANADTLDVVTVLGWHVVCKKGEFKSGDYVVYCEVDSLLPEKPEFEFLRNKQFRIRTIKLRGQISQGIVFPTSILPAEFPIHTEWLETHIGYDVTEELGITKYEKPIPPSLGGNVNGALPSYFPKTDEIRIQAVPEVLVRNKGQMVYITEKVDGSSVSAWKHEGKFGIGGRNWWFKEETTNSITELAKKLNLAEIIPDEICLQGEILGPGIQDNKYKLQEHIILWFNGYNISLHEYLTVKELMELTLGLHLLMVPILEMDSLLDYTVDQLVDKSKGFSDLGHAKFYPKDTRGVFNIHREGIVVRTVDNITDPDLGRLSFKVINPEFLLKYNE